MSEQPSVYEVAGDLQGAAACVCCPRALLGEDASGGWLVCRRCQAVMAGRLGEVLALWPGVDGADRRKGAVRREKPVRSFLSVGGSSAPGDMTVLNLVAGDVASRLERHEDAWRAARGWSGRPARGRQGAALKGVCQFLGDNLLWACQSYPEVWQLDDELRRLVRDMQTVVTGEEHRVVTLRVGCPYTAPGWEQDDPEAPACGGTLRCDLQRALIRCTDCWATLSTDRWAELGITVGTIQLDNQEDAA